MNWNTTGEFFAMGGYGVYVWGSFIVTALCMIAEPLLLRRRRRAAMTSVRQESTLHKESCNEKSA
ncbi:heme exporter protein CcmD [Noviherbaspirillum sp. CPCC 100848]|uniref:Heme exporter protein D n=1 Tax=Noviherbaspirillum album TaxID=3080276 RepID=A0ABU6JEZ4_9BURK|nr:heme exporter protein CcmD [Noviherbaspirillum sp. CPCC 100848]MEC4722229.1 heme exporter protein CcmD [Noviherbaspirillum sp. CPCC 100848]